MTTDERINHLATTREFDGDDFDWLVAELRRAREALLDVQTSTNNGNLYNDRRCLQVIQDIARRGLGEGS